jgi:hypothetical protein
MAAQATAGSLTAMQTLFCFNNLGFPLFFTCMIETKKVKMHNFASNKMGFLLFSCIARELTKEI